MSKSKFKKVLKKREFTKFLVVSLVVIYYAFYIFSVIMWHSQLRYMEDMLNYIARPFAIIVAAYLIKSSIHNNRKIKKSYNENKAKKKLSFSKVLMILITGGFFISIIYFCIAWCIKNEFPTMLFEYIATPFITALPSYVAKSVIENQAKDGVELANITESIMNVVNNGSMSAYAAETVSEIADKILHKKQKSEEEQTNIEEEVNIEPDQEQQYNETNDVDLENGEINFCNSKD